MASGGDALLGKHTHPQNEVEIKEGRHKANFAYQDSPVLLFNDLSFNIISFLCSFHCFISSFAILIVSFLASSLCNFLEPLQLYFLDVRLLDFFDFPDVVSSEKGELSFGLHRIARGLLGVNDMFRIRWGRGGDGGFVAEKGVF
ncbi:hypothetical protein Fot_52462 [Forsythia ovata]|uniref:Uncharacterized protein n=1 Tax=Forsythia ovata TaxID=205694 RepID=A0ABD1PKT0_9LAMI